MEKSNITWMNIYTRLIINSYLRKFIQKLYALQKIYHI